MKTGMTGDDDRDDSWIKNYTPKKWFHFFAIAPGVTRSDQDENRDGDWDGTGMMRSGFVGFLWQQLIKGKVYILALAQWSCELSCD